MTHPASGHSPFPPTRWSVVLRIRQKANDTSARAALADLCRTYWFPLYAYARRRGQSAHDAQDATQGFFAYLLQKELFAAAEPQMGRLRNFLLTAFQRYLGGLRDYQQAEKRGGLAQPLSLDGAAAEEQYLCEAVDGDTPEKLVERSWALTLLRSALESLAQEEAKAGRGAQFEGLQEFLTPAGVGEASHALAAKDLGVSEEAVRQAVSRLRRRFRAVLRKQVADTLSDPEESHIDEELSAMRAALRD